MNSNKLIEQSSNEVLRLLDLINEKDTEDLSSEATKQRWGGIYYDKESNESIGKTVAKIQNEAFRLFGSTNALYPTVWPSIANMQTDLIKLCISFCKGQHDAQKGILAKGILASGGTESILLALLAHREWAYSKNIKTPEIIAASTCHGACHKACFYFGMKLILVKPDEITQRISRHEVEPLITKNTIMIYSSAPTFPHGVVDDIKSLSELAKEYDIGLHIDNCLGGILLQYTRNLNLLSHDGYAIDAANGFENLGVTSISIDLHKYGFSSKGVSAVIFRNNQLRQFVFHPVAPVKGGKATGGGYITPTLQGSRSGGPIAASWATMKFMLKHYNNTLKHIHEAYITMKDGVHSIVGVETIGASEICIVGFRSSMPNTITNRQINKEMRKKGWALFSGENPSALGICVGEQHIHTCNKFCTDLNNVMLDLIEKAKTLSNNNNIATSTSNSKSSGSEDGGVYQAAPANAAETKMKSSLIRFIESGLDQNSNHSTNKLTSLIDDFRQSSKL